MCMFFEKSKYYDFKTANFDFDIPKNKENALFNHLRLEV